MRYVNIGDTNIKVSEICFGILTMSLLQLNYKINDYKPVLEYAIERGINFFDTAQYYKAYDLIKEAVKIKKDIVVCSKSYATNYETASIAINEALEKIGRDYIDIFLIHECDTEKSIEGSLGALERYLEGIKRGEIRALGISTHSYKAANSIKNFKELQVIMPIINFQGMGIIDGKKEDMERVLLGLKEFNKSIIAMKIFGGGHLLKDRDKAFKYVKALNYISSYAIGMSSIAEVKFNCDMIENLKSDINPPLNNKKLQVMSWCINCGECAKYCHHNALKIGKKFITIDKNKCVLCGYCGGKCKLNALKIF